jgi:hypothetical protein
VQTDHARLALPIIVAVLADSTDESAPVDSNQTLDLGSNQPAHMSTEHLRVTPVSLPAESAIAHAYATVNLSDAYSIELPAGTTTDPELLARFIFSQQAPWVRNLMAVRDALVVGLGLKTARHLTSAGAKSNADRVGIFKIYSTSQTEIILGEDDKHLDFRLSVLCSGQPSPASERHLILSTVVHCHNRLGRLYILLIAPFHRVVVQSTLRSAARMGWPSTADAQARIKNRDARSTEI